MSNNFSTIELSQALRSLAASHCSNPELEIGRYLDRQLAGMSLQDKLHLLNELAGHFKPDVSNEVQSSDIPSHEIHELVARFLGSAGPAGDISSQELAEKFGGALNALFDSVNQIVSIINVTLMGQSQELETIRKVIGANIQGETDFSSIRDYLERIKKAFLVAHQSFQLSTAALIDELITELDPEKLMNAQSSGLKFGPLRKADLFEQYQEKHARCKRWFLSGNYKEKLLREFERQCQLQINGAKR